MRLWSNRGKGGLRPLGAGELRLLNVGAFGLALEVGAGIAGGDGSIPVFGLGFAVTYVAAGAFFVRLGMAATRDRGEGR